MNDQPALSLLLVIGLLQFWLMPSIAWVLLRDQRDTAANFWFAGTACYAGSVTLFVFQSFASSAAGIITSLALVVLMLGLLAEALRRELHPGPTPWRWIAGLVALNVAAMIYIEATAGLNMMRAVQISVVSVLDMGLCGLLMLVLRKTRSRALWFVLSGLLVVVVTNLLRVAAYLTSGEPPVLLTFSWSSNLVFIANYLSVVVYSFGYWGFVIEKGRRALISESTERTRAQVNELQALDRERVTQELVWQREQLIAQLAQAQRAAQAGAVSASIAHEVNQPLASARLLMDQALAMQYRGVDPAELEQVLERVSLEIHRAATMIRRLREVFAGHEMHAEMRSIDVIVAETCELLQRQIQSSGIHLQTELTAAAQVEVGAGELEHVVLNLVTNAIDALSTAQTTQPTVIVSTWLDDDGVMLKVRDNGPGVSSEDRTRLFELFAGSNRSGMGFGLWLSRHIVERHGGQILLEDNPGQSGASFTVRLRRKTVTPGELT